MMMLAFVLGLVVLLAAQHGGCIPSLDASDPSNSGNEFFAARLESEIRNDEQQKCVPAPNPVRPYKTSSIPTLYTTYGEVWPTPMNQTKSDVVLRISAKFHIVSTVKNDLCDIMDEAVKRYTQLTAQSTQLCPIWGHSPPDVDVDQCSDDSTTLNAANVDQLSVSYTQMCTDSASTYPHLGMDESYSLSVEAGTSMLTANTVWGVLRGLETFSQLIYTVPGDIERVLNKSQIYDAPRYQHRGILLDTSRHYLPVNVIQANLDAMAYNKLNVFHWHIVDDTSFPYQSIVFPDLSAKGAFNSVTHIYTPEAVRSVIEYARLRGIRVIPEFDTPGHTDSWGQGQEGLLTPCYTEGEPDGTFGPINPTLTKNYDFLKNLFKEVMTVFPDDFLHLGGDEVSFNCWKSNPDVNKFMEKMNISGNYEKLEEVYMNSLLSILSNLTSVKTFMVWQEVFDNNVTLSKDTLIHVWKGSEYQSELSNVTKAGYSTLLSSPWYLNYNKPHDWLTFYNVEPSNFTGTVEQKQLLYGGEACMWGEWADATNALTKLWPRAGAIAERLWSPIEVRNTTTATPRLNEQRCRMLLRGIPCQPLDPSFCQCEYTPPLPLY